jgi:HEPN domain-containing protein
MSAKESRYPHDWFEKARQDIRTVEILLRAQGDAEVAGFHLQQAAEKYLKGYLLSQGWRLERIHNLEILLNEAVRFNPDLERFRDLCEEATDFYTFERYPFFETPGVSLRDIARLLPLLYELIREIESGVEP